MCIDMGKDMSTDMWDTQTHLCCLTCGALTIQTRLCICNISLDMSSTVAFVYRLIVMAFSPVAVAAPMPLAMAAADGQRVPKSD